MNQARWLLNMSRPAVSRVVVHEATRGAFGVAQHAAVDDAGGHRRSSEKVEGAVLGTDTEERMALTELIELAGSNGEAGPVSTEHLEPGSKSVEVFQRVVILSGCQTGRSRRCPVSGPGPDMACGAMTIRHRHKQLARFGAARLGQRATGAERAARGRGNRAGRVATQQHAVRPGAGIGPRDRGQQRLGIGVDRGAARTSPSRRHPQGANSSFSSFSNIATAFSALSKRWP